MLEKPALQQDDLIRYQKNSLVAGLFYRDAGKIVLQPDYFVGMSENSFAAELFRGDVRKASPTAGYYHKDIKIICITESFTAIVLVRMTGDDKNGYM